MKQKIARYFGLQNKPSSGATRRFVLQTEISGNFLFHTFFCFTYFVLCVFVSLTAVRISRSVYFSYSIHAEIP